MTAVVPDGCRHCGIPWREHCQRWTSAAGWHRWAAPTDEQRKARMIARRAERITAHRHVHQENR